jgi:sugar phosphate isomerase/epimerase
MPDLAVSTWSLHRTLGATYPGLDPRSGERSPAYPYGQGSQTLLDLPNTVAGLGIANLEICHFHFPRTDTPYLDQLRQRLNQTQVRPLTLLVDEGDIASADPAVRARDLALIRGWIDVAAYLQVQRVRVIAGQSAADPAGDAVRWSIEGLLALTDYARARGVTVVTENWLALAMDRAALLAILRGTGGAVGLCADFGNYRGPGKYDDLAAILPFASSIHAKASFSAPGLMDEVDFRRCLDLARAAQFSGSYVLIFDSAGDEKASLLQMASMVQPYL